MMNCIESSDGEKLCDCSYKIVQGELQKIKNQTFWSILTYRWICKDQLWVPAWSQRTRLSTCLQVWIWMGSLCEVMENKFHQHWKIVDWNKVKWQDWIKFYNQFYRKTQERKFELANNITNKTQYQITNFSNIFHNFDKIDETEILNDTSEFCVIAERDNDYKWRKHHCYDPSIKGTPSKNCHSLKIYWQNSHHRSVLYTSTNTCLQKPVLGLGSCKQQHEWKQSN